VKYKLIPAALHNFGHSFHSLTNYVDDQYITDIISELVRDDPQRKIVIAFPEGSISPPGEYPPALVKSIGYWSDSLPRHLASHRIDEGTVRNVRLSFQRPPPRCTVYAEDDRGKQYEIPVTQTN
jgi:hypothetical protein